MSLRVSSSSFNDGFLYETGNLEQQENVLQQQASSGLSVTSPEDNPAIMTQVLNLQSTSATNSQYQKNITQLQAAATTSATAMNNLQTITSQASEIAINASNGTTSSTQMASYATQVAALIQQALSIANTQDSNGNYIFSGTSSSTKPFSATTDASGNVTAVTYNGNTNTAESDIGPSATATADVPGENTTGSGAEGLFADSRTGSNVFADLISLQQNLAAGNSSAIASTTAPALTQDDNNVINQISGNGVMQSSLTLAGNIADATSTNITTQVSGETNADLATTMTQLDQTQTAYQAALESGTMVMNMSLLNFLA